MGGKVSRNIPKVLGYHQNSPTHSSVPPALKTDLRRQFSYIADNYRTVEEVTAALREAGLESSNLIVGVDFSRSNEWKGEKSFNGKSLHAISNIPNPYQQAISIIGRTLSPFDDDNLIPCFGFGDVSTHDQHVFSFFPNHQPCEGFEDALSRYQEILPNIKLSGPTSFAPIIETAIDIVVKSGCQYHVLLIIADGQVTRNSDIDDDIPSPQEESTIDAIVAASEYPLSIVLVGVGDGPWDMMRQFDDNIPQRKFDNFQFVNFTEIMSRNRSPEQKEAAFALAALMEIPFQYKAALSLRLLNQRIERETRLHPLPTPNPLTRRDSANYFKHQEPSSTSSPRHTAYGYYTHDYGSTSSQNGDAQMCPICLTVPKEMAFNCGHQTCVKCGNNLAICPICRVVIKSRLRLY